jgi:ribulose-bisphosphate carboxylase large chain
MNSNLSSFHVTYRIRGSREDVTCRAKSVCVEQTIEFPADLVRNPGILSDIVGQITDMDQVEPECWDVCISYSTAIVGAELTQLLNVIFGNASILPGIRVVGLEFPADFVSLFPGPPFGMPGLRHLTGAVNRPLLATALKPMGLSPVELADLAGQFARGKVDIIKDDHGLTNQAFCPFSERVKRCAEAVIRANEETGGNCLYAANITGPAEQLQARAAEAKNAGAQAVLVAPGLVGFDAVRRLAADDDFNLPILGHPAFHGSFVVGADTGIAHDVLFGTLYRLAGTDVTIFPNFGGRFSFSAKECRAIAQACNLPLGSMPPILPAPAGGMSLDRVPAMVEFYGPDVVLLIGGDLHRHGDLVGACRRFRELVQ